MATPVVANTTGASIKKKKKKSLTGAQQMALARGQLDPSTLGPASDYTNQDASRILNTQYTGSSSGSAREARSLTNPYEVQDAKARAAKAAKKRKDDADRARVEEEQRQTMGQTPVPKPRPVFGTKSLSAIQQQQLALGTLNPATLGNPNEYNRADARRILTTIFDPNAEGPPSESEIESEIESEPDPVGTVTGVDDIATLQKQLDQMRTSGYSSDQTARYSAAFSAGDIPAMSAILGEVAGAGAGDGKGDGDGAIPSFHEFYGTSFKGAFSPGQMSALENAWNQGSTFEEKQTLVNDMLETPLFQQINAPSGTVDLEKVPIDGGERVVGGDDFRTGDEPGPEDVEFGLEGDRVDHTLTDPLEQEFGKNIGDADLATIRSIRQALASADVTTADSLMGNLVDGDIRTAIGNEIAGVRVETGQGTGIGEVGVRPLDPVQPIVPADLPAHLRPMSAVERIDFLRNDLRKLLDGPGMTSRGGFTEAGLAWIAEMRFELETMEGLDPSSRAELLDMISRLEAGPLDDEDELRYDPDTGRMIGGGEFGIELPDDGVVDELEPVQVDDPVTSPYDPDTGRMIDDPVTSPYDPDTGRMVDPDIPPIDVSVPEGPAPIFDGQWQPIYNALISHYGDGITGFSEALIRASQGGDDRAKAILQDTLTGRFKDVPYDMQQGLFDLGATPEQYQEAQDMFARIVNGDTAAYTEMMDWMAQFGEEPIIGGGDLAPEEFESISAEISSLLSNAVNDLGFDPTELRTALRGQTDADYEQARLELAREFALDPGGEFGGAAENRAIDLQRERLKIYNQIEVDIQTKAREVQERNVEILTNSFATAAGAEATTAQQSEVIRQFDESMVQRIEEFGKQFGLTEEHTQAMISQIYADIDNQTRQLSADIGQKWAEITGQTGMIGGELNGADLGIKTVDQSGFMPDAEVLSSGEAQKARLGYQAMTGQELSDEDLLSILRGSSVAVESMPTLEARKMAHDINLQNMERIAKYDSIADSLQLDRDKFQRVNEQNDKEWNRLTGNVMPDQPDRFRTARFFLESQLNDLFFDNTLSAEEKVVRQTEITNDVAMQFFGEAGAAEFLAANDQFSALYGDAQRAAALGMGMDSERYADGKRQADRAEQRFMDTWASVMGERAFVRRDINLNEQEMQGFGFDLLNATSDVDFQFDEFNNGRENARLWIEAATPEQKEHMESVFHAQFGGSMSDDNFLVTLGNYFEWQSGDKKGSFEAVNTRNDWFFELESDERSDLLALLGTASQSPERGRSGSFLESLGRTAAITVGAVVGSRTPIGPGTGATLGNEVFNTVVGA